MKGIRSIELVGEQYLGSNVQIQAVFDEAPTSVILKIRDSQNTVVVDGASMVSDSGGLYFYYDYQQLDVNNYGEYLLIVKAFYGISPVYSEYRFSMYNLDPNQIGGF